MRLVTLAATVLMLALSGCGGGGEEAVSTESETAATPPTPKAAAAAETICSELAVKAGRMGAEFSSSDDPGAGTMGGLELTTEKLIAPAIPIIENASRRLRALRPQAESVQFDAYVNFYDPIAALLRERVEAGRAGDTTRARALERELIELGELQRRLASDAGLVDCDIDLIQAFAAGEPAG